MATSTPGALPDDPLDLLESEALHLLHCVLFECDRPAVLFSGGKDSAVVLHLASKASWPERLEAAVLHVDTGHNFPETISYRDATVASYGAKLVVASVQAAIDSGRLVDDTRPGASRNALQSPVLLDAVAAGGFDALVGGARRDEEKARAKERMLSVRDARGGWDPNRQRPELWQLHNPRIAPGEHLRAFPLSNWTELDVWHYVAREGIELPSIYFAHRRLVVEREGMLVAVGPFTPALPGEKCFEATVRYRTVGDMTCTAAVASSASSVGEVIAELEASRTSERGATRLDDRGSPWSMEERKREGYF